MLEINRLPPLSRARERLLARLGDKKFREEQGLFLIEGVRVLEEALAAGVAVRWAAVAEEGAGGRAESVLEGLQARGVELFRTGGHALARALDVVTPQGVAAVCELPALELARLELPERALVVVVDALSQPGNLGAVLRVAAAAGAEALLLGPGCADPFSPKSVRGSAGTLFKLPLAAGSREELEGFLAREGFAVYEAAMSGDDVFALEAVPSRVALVLGSEAGGTTRALAGLAARKLAVPMRRGVESLNVAVAAGIILYALARAAGRD